MRNYKTLISEADKNTTLVVTREELILLRKKYDKKYTLYKNELEASSVFRGSGRLQGVKLAIGKWL